jgi:hypothetical protein
LLDIFQSSAYFDIAWRSTVAQPLSNLDYLIDAVKRSPASPAGDQAAREKSGDVPPSFPPTAIQETVLAFGAIILRALQKGGGKLGAYQLVKATEIPLETLFHVLDKLASDFHWVNVDKSDAMGNYQIELTPEGRDYMKRLGL